MAEYNAFIIKLQIAEEMEMKYLEIYGNSKLIIN